MKPTNGAPLGRNQRNELPRVRVGLRHGRPLLFWNDEPCFHAAYWPRHVTDRAPNGAPTRMEDRERFVRELADLCRPFARRGIHAYEVPVSIGWNGPHAWDWEHPQEGGEPARDQLKAVTSADPDARCMVHFCIHAPAAWRAACPDEFELDADGNRHEVSIGSDLYLGELLENLPRFIRHLEDGPYARHVLTYFFSYGHEGFTLSSLSNGVSDFSGAMHRCFRAWLKTRYGGSVGALRAAWGEQGVTFDTAAVPSRDEQFATDLGWFRDPTKNRKLFDYIQCRVDRYVDIHFRVARAIKEGCRRRVPVYCFGAYLQVTGWPGSYWSDTRGLAEREFNPHALSVQTGWRRIIECPDIDGWESPFDYFYRQMGGVCLNQSLDESMRLRGKAFQINEDTRTFLAWQAKDVYGTVATREETTAVHRRNFGAMASQWSGANWMEQIHNWLMDDGILDQLGEFNRLLQRAVDWPETPVDPIGVFIDEGSINVEKPLIDLDWDLIYRQRVFGLAHCGVPFRVHLVDDLMLDNMPEYRCCIFLNLFLTDGARERLIRKAVQRGGKTVLWMVAPGFCHARDGLGLESMRRLTGIRFAKYDLAQESWTTLSDYTHPITRGLAHDLTYGSSARIGPAFYVADPDARVLGRRLMFQGRHEPALAIKEFKTHRALYSAAPLLPADLLREIARYAGCHVYTEENDVVMAGHGLITYHTVAPGPRVLSLPRPATVYDLFTGRCLGRNVRKVRLAFARPGTRVLTTLAPGLWKG